MVNKQINLEISTNSEETQKEFERLRKAIKASTEQVEDLSKQFGENSAQADAARKSLAGLNNAYDEMSKSATDLGATFEDIYGEVLPLTTALGESEDRLYQLALAGDTTSREYQDLLKKVSDYRKVQIQTDLAVDSAATTMDQKLGGAIQGAVSGFAAVQGAMGLLGSESEQLEKTLLKVQSALAIAEGVRGIRENIGYFKQLGSTVTGVFNNMTKSAKIFTATGIGLAITAVATLTDVFKSTTKETNNYRKAVDQTNAVTQKAIENAANELSALDQLQGTLEDETLTREEKNKAVDDLQEKYPSLLKNVSAEKLSIEELNAAVANNIKLAEARARISAAESLRAQKYTEILQEEIGLQDLRNEIEEERQKIQEAEQYGANVAQRRIDLILLEVELETREKNISALKEEVQQIDGLTAADKKLLDSTQKVAEAYEDKTKKQTKSAKQINDLSRQIEDEQIRRIADEEAREIKLLETTAKRRKEDLEKQLKERTITAKQERALATEIETNLELDIEAVRKKYFELRKQADLARLNEIQDFKAVEATTALNSLQDQLNKEILLRKAAADKQTEIDEKAAERRKQIRDFGIESTKQGLEIIAALTDIYGNKSEKAARQAFRIQKAVSISQATIDTYKSANAIFAAASANPSTVLFPAQPFIAAGLAIASGLANVATIASQKFEGGGTTPSTTTPDTAGLEGGAITPQFNVVGDSGINQLAQLQQQPVQAYVVSGEVTSAQALDRNRVKNATL